MNDEQLLRYARHILLDELGIEGQEKLLAARVLIVGAGGLGSPAALYLATPDGRLSRYFYGVKHDKTAMRLSLVEASQGKVGSTFDRLLLTCYHWDPASGTYAPAALRLVRAGGLLTLLVLGIFLATFWRRDVRRHRTA